MYLLVITVHYVSRLHLILYWLLRIHLFPSHLIHVIYSSPLSFHYSDCLILNFVLTSSSSLKFICINRPPIPSCTTFANQFTDLIHSLTIAGFKILDDFIYHYGSPVGYHATFTDIINSSFLSASYFTYPY